MVLGGAGIGRNVGGIVAPVATGTGRTKTKPTRLTTTAERASDGGARRFKRPSAVSARQGARVAAVSAPPLLSERYAAARADVGAKRSPTAARRVGTAVRG